MKKQKLNKKYGHYKWTDIWHTPFRYDGYNYVWDRNNIMTLMFDEQLSEETRNGIVTILNGEREGTIDGIRVDNGEFFVNDTYIFCIRAWGHLTGRGGLNLPSEVAARLQDDFANHILNKLRNNGKKRN